MSEESKRSNRAGSVEKTEQGEPVDAAEKEGTAEKKEEDNVRFFFTIFVL